MARTGITYDQVAATADLLFGQGNDVSILTVRAQLGTGSPNTIHKHLTLWRETRPQQARAERAPLASTIIDSIYEAQERVKAEARAEIENKLVQAQIESDELSTIGEALERERDALAEEVTTLKKDRDELKGKADLQAVEIKELKGAIDREQKAAEIARTELAKELLKIDSQGEKIAEQKIEIDRLKAQLEKVLGDKHQAEKSAAVYEADLKTMTDRMAKAEASLAQAATELDSVKDKLTKTTIELKSHEINLKNAAEARNNALNDLKEAKAEIKKARAEIDESRAKFDTANAELSTIKAAKERSYHVSN
jgi:colicin import membrane protein